MPHRAEYRHDLMIFKNAVHDCFRVKVDSEAPICSSINPFSSGVEAIETDVCRAHPSLPSNTDQHEKKGRVWHDADTIYGIRDSFYRVTLQLKVVMRFLCRIDK